MRDNETTGTDSVKPDGQFYWIDTRLPEDTRLSPQDKYVWTILNSFTDDDGQCYMSMDTLARRAGICVRMAQYSMKNLCKTCWVKKCHQTSLRTTLYQLRKPEGYQILHPMTVEKALQPAQKPEGYQILQSDIPNLAPSVPNLAPYLDVVQIGKISTETKREIVHKRESVSHIPKITFNHKTLQMEFDDKARLTFDLAYPHADFDVYIGNVRGWIIRTGKVRLNYWKSLCTFVEHDRQKQNTMPLSGYAPPPTPFTDEERKDKKKALYDGFGDEPGDDSINLIDGRS